MHKNLLPDNKCRKLVEGHLEKRRDEIEQYVVVCCRYPSGLKRSNLSKSSFHGFCSFTRVLKLAIYKNWYQKQIDDTVVSPFDWYRNITFDEIKEKKRGVVPIPDCNMAAQECWHSQGHHYLNQRRWIVSATSLQWQVPNVHPWQWWRTAANFRKQNKLQEPRWCCNNIAFMQEQKRISYLIACCNIVFFASSLKISATGTCLKWTWVHSKLGLMQEQKVLLRKMDDVRRNSSDKKGMQSQLTAVCGKNANFRGLLELYMCSMLKLST